MSAYTLMVVTSMKKQKESYFNYIKRWNKWRKNNANSWLHKGLVLIKLVHSPSMSCYFYK